MHSTAGNVRVHENSTKRMVSALSLVPFHDHDVLRSPGWPLDQETWEFMDPRFGHALGGAPIGLEPATEIGFITLMWRAHIRGDQRDKISEKRPAVHRLVRFLPVSVRTKALADLATAGTSYK